MVQDAPQPGHHRNVIIPVTLGVFGLVGLVPFVLDSQIVRLYLTMPRQIVPGAWVLVWPWWPYVMWMGAVGYLLAI